MTAASLLRRASFAAVMSLVAASAAHAAGGGDKPAEPPPPEQHEVRVIDTNGKPVSADASGEPPSDVERYCTAIADPARETRQAIQAERLKALEAQVNARIDELEKKRAEYQDWLQQRQAFLDSTSDIVLDIYVKMKPDAAAQQLAGIERTTAASLLARMKPRAASAILTEMPAGVAAEIGNLIVEKTSKTPDGAMAASAKG